jgi:peptidoglycan/xylan/chitin deacetylase (PgdA/CDA1 family)
MQQLLALGYVPWPLRKVLAYHQQRRPIPGRVFVVVFDDGYANVYHHAYPVLRRLGIPATILLATAYLDQDGPFPFDESACDAAGNRAPDDFRPLTTAQCREMYDDGLVDLGSHTHTHVDFRGHDELFRADLSRSLDVLRQSFGIERATFSFPFGFTSPALIEIARQLGLACGLTTEVDLVRPGDDPLQWSRLGATQLDSGLTLAAKLDGWYTALRKGWRRLRVGRAV